LCFFVLLCAYLCLFGSQKHNISLLPWLVLTPSLAWGLLEPLAPPSWLVYKLLEPLMLICAHLCFFVLLCAYLCLFGSQKHNISLLPWLLLTPSLACGLLEPLAPPLWLVYKLLEPLMLICAYLCLFGSQKHNIFLLPWLLLTPSLACGLLQPLAPLLAFVQAPGAFHASLCLFLLIWLSKHNISLLSWLWLTPSFLFL